MPGFGKIAVARLDPIEHRQILNFRAGSLHGSTNSKNDVVVFGHTSNVPQELTENFEERKNHVPAHVEDSKLLGERLGWPRIAISEGRVSDKITLCQLGVSLKAGMDIFSGLASGSVRLGIGVRPGNLDNLFLRPANPQAKTPSGTFLQS